MLQTRYYPARRITAHHVVSQPSEAMSYTVLPPEEQAQLLALAKSAARFGTFTLRSGKTSDFYFDGRLVTLTANGAWLLARAIHRLVPDEAGITAVGGPTLGADPMATAVAVVGLREFERNWDAFIVRKEAKEHGASKQLEGPELNAASRVLVVEDTVTSGGSVLRALEPIRATGATVVQVVALLDREEGAAEAFANASIPFTPLLRRADLA